MKQQHTPINEEESIKYSNHDSASNLCFTLHADLMDVDEADFPMVVLRPDTTNHRNRFVSERRMFTGSGGIVGISCSHINPADMICIPKNSPGNDICIIVRDNDLNGTDAPSQVVGTAVVEQRIGQSNERTNDDGPNQQCNPDLQKDITASHDTKSFDDERSSLKFYFAYNYVPQLLQCGVVSRAYNTGPQDQIREVGHLQGVGEEKSL